ncbi:hypothetical protein QBZ16_000262 [Prototheca wickerhamii]|uniref:quinolinate synthase n=1 Tax=Prototheca wickerhamii TaxID=3111 RepID=A0AAD9IN63_PROWI|nr:hypothetical protein QBZ16_000262 [Prototheca wickerhamii]
MGVVVNLTSSIGLSANPELLAAFGACGDDRERSSLLLTLARSAPRPGRVRPPRRHARRGLQLARLADVRGGRVWAAALAADSDSELHRGLCAVALAPLQGLRAAEVLAFDAGGALAPLGARWGALDAQPRQRPGLAAGRGAAPRARARARPGAPGPFPSLVIGAGGVAPRGAYAEAQARYLDPDAARVDALVAALSAKRVGVVAHFYMDPEVQGVLASAAQRWPHVAISDSLVMADKAVAMARGGCEAVAVLGVDFMSENVRAMLDEAGYGHVAVYRMDPGAIGCSLAEAAESAAYKAYVARAAAHPSPAIHVVYINTSLRTKARAQAAVPTITCTSSNVVNTVLSAYAAIPGVHVWYGPDSAASVRDALARFHYFDAGMCVVHHMFGAAVCETVRDSYADAYIAAHFEVPGEMFALGLEASRRGAGVVGSTSNILDFILAKVRQATAADEEGKAATSSSSSSNRRLQFVLGTETGMITAIVRAVRAELEALPAERRVEVEVVFPVAADAIATAEQARDDAPLTLPGGLAVVPGPAGGEGCSAAGGCASCPYMKMNTLDALVGICDAIGDPRREAALAAHAPVPYRERVQGRSVAALGCETILHMRDFQRDKRIPDRLVEDVLARKGAE